MIRNSFKLSALAAVAALGAVTTFSCSKSSTPGQGDVELALVLPGGSTISSVTYTVLSSSSATLASGTINVSDPNATISLDVTLPVGTGDTVKLSATASDGTACSGTSMPFNVVSGQSTAVMLTLTCGGGQATNTPGSANITANVVTQDNCPSITSAVAAPAQTSVGQQIAISAAASDADANDTLTFAWAPAANFTNPAAASTNYTCTAPGTQTITLTVNDGHNPACATGPATITMTVTCVSVSTCGNGVVEPGEQCEPPNTATCSSTCQTIGGTGGAAAGGAPGTGGAAAGGAPGTGGATGGTTGTGGATGGTTGTGGSTGPIGDSIACRTCELNNTTAGNCFNDNATVDANGNVLPGTTVPNFGCDSFTGTDQTNCLNLLACLQGATCKSAIASASPDYQEAAVGGDSPLPCLCGNIPLATCLGLTSFTGVCAPQYMAAGGSQVLQLFTGNAAEGVATNLFTCDIDAPCTTECGVGLN